MENEACIPSSETQEPNRRKNDDEASMPKQSVGFNPSNPTSDWQVSSPYNNQHIVQQTGGRKRQIYQPDNII